VQQRAHGADVGHAFMVAQAAPQGEPNEHGRRPVHEKGKAKSIGQPGGKPQGKPNRAGQNAEREPELSAKPAAKTEFRPAANPHERAAPYQASGQRGNEVHQRSEIKRGEEPREYPAAAQKEAPAAGRRQKSGHKNAEQVRPESGKPNRVKESVKPAPQKIQKVEQNRERQPSAKAAGKSVQQPANKASKTAQQPAPNSERAAAPPPPTKPRSASAFISRQGEKPVQGLNEIRRSRQEVRQGNRVVIREGDRTIERENNRAIIRHSESDRFAVGARQVDVEHRNDQTVTIVVRPNGVRIISTTDRYGHLIRRVRQDPNGQEIVIIDDSRWSPSRRDEMFVDVPPPRIYDRDRDFVDADRADRRRLYQILTAPPIERLQGRYTVDQVRYSYPLREYMPRVDLDIHFDTGSWQLTPDQVDRLSEIADALKEAIDHNPREVYLIEGHTDAVGSWEDNLSLSDRRAEAIAVALTHQFHVPPENLVTQGYGEQYLKVQTQGPSRANRRVSVRRITPLIERAESQGRR
jgi:OmpA-OmpF porin, OOP family